MDTLSFWLGFLTATILWFLIQYFRKLWPRLRELFENRTAVIRQLSAIGSEDRLRKEILHKAQSGHLSASLFALDEISIAPRLLAPLPQVSPDNPAPLGDIVSKTISYLPDWPEFGAHFGINTLDLEIPIAEGLRVAIVGHPGSGKSIALSFLATRILRKENKTQELNEVLPILFHVLDLSTPYPAHGDPIKPIFDLLTSSQQPLVINQDQAVLRAKLLSGKLLLLIDGMDELYNTALTEFSAYLESLLNQYPQLKVVITLSFDNWDGTSRLGFKPFALAAWSETQSREFINRWTSAWVKEVIPLLPGGNQNRPPDPLLVQNWLSLNHHDLTPLEWTLLVWGTCAGDLRGNSSQDAIISYIKRFQDQRSISDLANLGVQMLENKQFFLPQSLVAQPDEKELLASRLSIKPKQSEPDQFGSLKSLIKQGFFIERSGDRVSYSHPVLACYLASQVLNEESQSLENIQIQSPWIGKSISLKWVACIKDLSEYLSPLIKSSEEPLYYDLFHFARWLRDVPSEHAWKKQTIERLLEFLQREMLPDAIRQRSLAALVLTGDPDLFIILRALLQHSSPSVVSLAALASTNTTDAQWIDSVIALLENPSISVRISACLALSSIKNQSAVESLAKALIQADEDTRMAAAEALANDPVQGYPVLKDAAEEEDILIRRASVAGLSRIREPWALEILSKLRIEDGQWIIRDAAARAVENIEAPNPYIPRPQVKPESASWLITFAARQGVGIPAGTPPLEMLLHVLKSGDEEERLGALEYLRMLRQPDIIHAIQEASICSIHSVREAATNILFDIIRSGESISTVTPAESEKTAVSTLLEHA